MPKNRIISPNQTIGPLLVRSAIGMALICSPFLNALAQTQNVTPKIHQTELHQGESLKQCLERLKIGDPEIYRAINQGSLADELANLPANLPIKLKVEPNEKVQTLKVPLAKKPSLEGGTANTSIDEIPVLVLVRPSDQPSKLKAIHLNEKTQVKLANKSGPFDGNFFNVMDRQDIPDAVSEQFVRIFSGSINFLRDLTRDSSFTMKYEVVYWDNHPIATGKILYSAINTPRKNVQGYWWKSKEDKLGNYYSVDGEILSSLSWKTPILYTRKTSNYGLRPTPLLASGPTIRALILGRLSVLRCALPS